MQGGIFALVSQCSVLQCCLLTKAVVTVEGPLHILCCLFLNQDYHVAAVSSGFILWLLKKVQCKVGHVQTQGCID